MKIVGLVKSSLIDYPGRIAAVIFTYGCNFRCRFCHNPDLVIGKITDLKEYSEEEILAFLDKRKKVLDGVVITGGEPLINQDIDNFIRKIKDMGYNIKLDTNGANPEMLKRLIGSALIDFIAMDIKNSESRYAETIGTEIDVNNIKKSIDIIMNSGMPYEFRSTILSKLHSTKDLKEMGEMIKGANKFIVQGFRPNITLDKDYEKEKSFTFSELEKIRKIFEGYVKEVEIRDNL